MSPTRFLCASEQKNMSAILMGRYSTIYLFYALLDTCVNSCDNNKQVRIFFRPDYLSPTFPKQREDTKIFYVNFYSQNSQRRPARILKFKIATSLPELASRDHFFIFNRHYNFALCECNFCSPIQPPHNY